MAFTPEQYRSAVRYWLINATSIDPSARIALEQFDTEPARSTVSWCQAQGYDAPLVAARLAADHDEAEVQS